MQTTIKDSFGAKIQTFIFYVCLGSFLKKKKIMRQFLASINVVFSWLAQLSTESRVDIGFNPLKLFSDASVNSSLVESSTASSSTHNTNQVSLKWNGT